MDKAFTIRDMADMTRLLGEHPEWRSELRRLVLSEEVLSLPEIVRDLAERMDQLAERVDQLSGRVDELAAIMAHLGHTMDDLAASHQRMYDDIGGMKGKMLEMEYRERCSPYFGRLLRRPRLVTADELWDSLEAVLDDRELDDALLADVFVRGRVRGQPDSGDVILVVEVSFVVDGFDVARAARRAGLLRRAGLPAVPVAAGERVTDSARTAAEETGVALLERLDPIHWETALRLAAA